MISIIEIIAVLSERLLSIILFFFVWLFSIQEFVEVICYKISSVIRSSVRCFTADHRLTFTVIKDPSYLLEVIVHVLIAVVGIFQGNI